MANSFSQEPFLINAVMTATYQSSQPLLATSRDYLAVTQVLWTGMSASDHQFVISSPSPVGVRLQGQAGTTLSDQSYVFQTPVEWSDFQVTRLDSGTLLIWAKRLQYVPQ